MGRYVTRTMQEENFKKMVETVRNGYISNGIYHRPNKQFATILVLEANLGCRIGDIVNLTTDSIIRDGQFWKLNIVEEKTGKKRNFIVPEAVKAFIDDYCNEEGIYSGRIFKCSKAAVWKNMRFITEYMDLTDTSTHSLRKMKAEKLYEESGHDIELVCSFLNHSHIETTRRYLKRSDAQLEKAISDTVTLA